ncbi:hypothetical protein ES707_06686 [subsurface metagenome]
MRELAKGLSKENSAKWKELKLLPRDQYRQIMLSLDIADAVLDYITKDDIKIISDFAAYLDQVIIDFHKE